MEVPLKAGRYLSLEGTSTHAATGRLVSVLAADELRHAGLSKSIKITRTGCGGWSSRSLGEARGAVQAYRDEALHRSDKEIRQYRPVRTGYVTIIV